MKSRKFQLSLKCLYYLYSQFCFDWESLPCYLLGLISLTLVSLGWANCLEINLQISLFIAETKQLELILSQSNQQSPITDLTSP